MRVYNKHRGLLVLFAFLSAAIVLGFSDIPSYQGFSTVALNAYIAWLAQATGWIGLFFLFWQTVLSNRLIVRKFTRDLTLTRSITTQLTLLASVLLLIHPIITAYTYGWEILATILPRIAGFSLPAVIIGKLAILTLAVFWLAYIVNRFKPSASLPRYLRLTLHLALPLGFVHAYSLSRVLSNSDPALVGFFLIVFLYLVTIVLQTIHFFGFGQISYKLIAKKELNPKIYRFTFEPIKKPLKSLPGQYIFIKSRLFQYGYPLTVSQQIRKDKTLNLIVKLHGSSTSRFNKLQIGQTVKLDGPYGNFTKKISAKKPTVLIAGGIGVIPFIEHALASKNKHIFLFNCNHNLQSTFMRKELKLALGRRYVDVLSENSKGRNIEVGFITPDIIRKYISKDLAKLDFYICGPTPMMQSVREQLINYGVGRENITIEIFSS
ncbi:hypothetical protein H6798_03920 [Candidatus Nomurabacteria bacterium]|nr:hypothetical protein [Candidatus Nomurabacteria bacterium]